MKAGMVKGGICSNFIGRKHYLFRLELKTPKPIGLMSNSFFFFNKKKKK